MIQARRSPAGILWRMPSEALLIPVSAAVAIVVLLYQLLAKISKRKRKGRRRRRRCIQRRRAAPISAHHYCAHCAVRVLRGPRTQQAWEGRLAPLLLRPVRSHAQRGGQGRGLRG